MKPNLILGLGNPLMGDDGIGFQVVERLLADSRLPDDVEAAWGGTDLLGCQGLLEGRERIVLVDAVETPKIGPPRGATHTVVSENGPPRGATHTVVPESVTRTVVGEVVELDPEDEALDHASPSAHALSLPAALVLLRRTVPGLAAADFRFLGVTVERVAAGDHLSPTLERRLPAITERILAAVAGRGAWKPGPATG